MKRRYRAALVPAKPSLAQYRLLRTIGTGTFSRVRVAVHKRSREIVVIKIMNKQDLIRRQQEEHVRSERNLLTTIGHPFVVTLKAAFQDRNRLYMVQEFVAGGELYRHLRNRGRLSLEETRFYAAEVMAALSYLHSQRIVYRDLKPENLLLTQSGHIKLTDFGFAKQLPVGDKTYTLCGTPEYLAPEVVQQCGHDFSCDWWSTGVLIFEMLSGHAPFRDPNPFKLYEKIVSAPLVFPEKFDESAKSLIRGLLEKMAPARMTQTQARAHEFFQGVDWKAVEQTETTPPYVPPLRAPDDTSNFDHYAEDSEQSDFVSSTFDHFQNF